MPHSKTIVCWTDEGVSVFLCRLRSGRATIVQETTQPCRVPDSLCTIDEDEWIVATARAIEEVGIHNESLTLVIPLHWCFLQTVRSTSKLRSEEELTFEFEPFLPMALEEVTCAFQSREDGNFLGVAVPTDPMSQTLEKLAAHGVVPTCIAVDVLVAGQLQVSKNKPLSVMVNDARWRRGLLTDSECQLLCVAVAASSNDECPSLTSNAADDSDGIPCATDRAAVLNLRWGAPSTTEPAEDEDQNETLSIREVVEFVATHPPAVDLRTGLLAGDRRVQEQAKLGRHCMVLATVMFLVALGLMAFQNRVLHRHLQSIHAEKQAVYQQIFANHALPPAAAMRLASERQRLEGLTRTRVQTTQSVETSLPPPLDTLRNIAEALPVDVPVLLQEARVDERQLSLRGQTREHRDAERIVEAINKVSGVQALSPRTNRLKSGGVEFSINAGGFRAK